MTPEQIEACARMCGWTQYRNFNEWVGHPGGEVMVADKALTMRGLLAVEDALLKKGWTFDYCSYREPRLPSYRWDIGEYAVGHPDRATSAVLAVMKTIW